MINPSTVLGSAMQKSLFLGIGCSFAMLLAVPGLAQEIAKTDAAIACTYDHKKPITSGEAKLSIKAGKINRIWFNSYYPGGRGELGFTCHLDFNRGDEAFMWQDNGLDTIVTAKDTKESLTINRDKKGYRLNFANFRTLSNYCGSGAEVPLAVFIPFSSKPCKVRLTE